ncbi:hypothetical protein JCM16303_003815 [Sporobolomyces ruberrimus]
MSLPPLETLTLSDTPDISTPRDRLTTLPPELFDHINSFIYNSFPSLYSPYPGPYLGAVSRAFLHNARTHHFGEIFLGDQVALRKYVAAITGYRTTARCTTRVEIDFSDGPEDDGHVPDEDIVMFLARLVSLTHLEVKAFQRFSKIVANPPQGFRPLPKLESLFLIDEFYDWRNPLDPQHWGSLYRYPSLVTFNLSCKLRNADNIVPHESVLVPRPNPSITDFHLSGYYLGENASLPALFDHFPNAAFLTFIEKSTIPELVVEFLKKITRPERVFHLSILGLSHWQSDFPPSLERFTNLGSITLGTGTWQSPKLTDTLLGFKHLESVCLGDVPDDQELLRFVQNAPTLDYFAFNNNFRGPEPGFPPPLTLEDQLEQGWTEVFTPEGVLEAARVAQERGVKVTGETVGFAQDVVEEKLRRDEMLKRLRAVSDAEPGGL